MKWRNWKRIGAALGVAVINFINTPDATALTHVWTGAGGNGLWSNPANWQGGSKPLFGETDVKIVFPTNGTATSTVDIPSLVVNEILVTRPTANGVTLGGSAGMKLTLESRPNFTPIKVLSGTLTLQSSLELVLSNQCAVLVDGTEECEWVTFPGVPPYWDCDVLSSGSLVILSKITGPGGLTFSGIGTSTLGGSSGNTYDGLTTVHGSHRLFLNKSSGNAIPATLWNNSGDVTLLDDHQISNTASVTNSGDIYMTNRTETFGPMTFLHGRVYAQGGQVTLAGDIRVSGPTNSSSEALAMIQGTVDLGTLSGFSRGRGIHVETNLEFLIWGSVSGSSNTTLLKEGPGTLRLSGASTFDGVAKVSEGILAAEENPASLGSTNGHTYVSDGGTLLLRGSWVDGGFFGGGYYTAATNREPVMLHGGTLSGESDSEYQGAITLVTNSIIAGETVVRGPISGTGDLSIEGSVRFAGNQPNTYSGATIVRSGALALFKSPTITAVPHDLSITGNANWLSGSFVELEAAHQIADSANVALYGNSEFRLGSYLETVHSLTLNGGEVSITTGLLLLHGNITATPATNTWDPPTIAGALHLKAGSHGIHVNPKPTNSNVDIDLVISGPISSDQFIGFTKTGAGHLELSGTNTFSGAVVVDDGGIIAGRNAAFGNPGGGVFIDDGSFVHLDNEVDLGTEGVWLRGGTLTLGPGAHELKGGITLVTNSVVEVSNEFSALILSSAITGGASLTKTGPGRMELVGSTANTFSGVLSIDAGELWLSKTNVIAVPNALIIGTLTNPASLRIFRNAQLSQSAVVVADHPGSLFDLQGFSQGLPSLSWAGAVNIGSGSLTIGATGDGSGAIGGSISGNGVLHKYGTGPLTLSGNNSFSGITYVHNGMLTVNGSHALSQVNVSGGGKLSGSGSVGSVGAYGFGQNNAWVMPGTSAGKLTTKNFTNGALARLQIELNGPVAGTSYDQVDVIGAVNLAGELQVLRNFNATNGSKFTIIKNDGADAIMGTFAGLAQNATFSISGAQFQISYTGGDGNDVVLTQTSVPQPAQLGGIHRLPNGHMQIAGTGIQGQNYDVQANANLGTTNWVWIGNAVAAGNGALSFTDTNASNFAMRFYQFVTP